MTCYNVVTYTAKLYNHVIPNKGTQVIDSPAATFEGSWYREIDMVNSYNSNKVESLKAKRYTLQSSNPMHPASFNCALEIVNGIEEKGRKVMAFILWSIDRFQNQRTLIMNSDLYLEKLSGSNGEHFQNGPY